MSRICFYLNLLCSGGHYSCHVSAVFDVYRIKCVGGSIFIGFFFAQMKMVLARHSCLGIFLCTSRSVDVEGGGSTGRHDLLSGLV